MQTMYSLTDLCCLCLVNGKSIKSISLLDNDGVLMKNKLEYVLSKSEVINLKSEVLNHICTDCLNALNYVYKFKRKCIQNLLSLNNYIKNISTKTEEHNQPGKMQDPRPHQMPSANQCTSSGIQYNHAERNEMIQNKNDHSFQIQELKCVMSNAECTITPDNSEHLICEYQIPQNNEETEIFKHEIEYINDPIDIKHDPLLFDVDSSANISNEPTNSSECTVTSENSKHLMCENKIPQNNEEMEIMKHEIEYTDDAVDNKNDPLLLDVESAENTRISFPNDPTNNSEYDLSHVKKDTNKSYKCNDCSKIFKFRHALTLHKRTHSGEKPFKCLICQMKFTRKSYLVDHDRIHSGKEPYECNLCDKSFTHRGNLAKHKLIHSRERPYECDMCDQKFTQRSQLKTHKLVHSSVKQFKCGICDKRFKIKSSLVIHERLHSGDKPYECNICDKRFIQSGHLAKHKRVHSGKKQLKLNQSIHLNSYQ